jgi:hypothetical protein
MFIHTHTVPKFAKTIRAYYTTAKTQYETAMFDIEKHKATKPEKDNEELFREKTELDKLDYQTQMNELTFKLAKHKEAVKKLGK